MSSISICCFEAGAIQILNLIESSNSHLYNFDIFQIREDRLHRLHFLQTRKNQGKEVFGKSTQPLPHQFSQLHSLFYFKDDLVIVKATHKEEKPNYNIESIGNYLDNQLSGCSSAPTSKQYGSETNAEPSTTYSNPSNALH